MSTRAQASAGPRYTPDELATRLSVGYRPTDEQAAIIAAPADDPLLVVAGAGSGKTETMAARVIWLVANDYVRADAVLGLTFTRKAAGELAQRIRQRLATLQRQLGREDLTVGEPTVSTYHSYAARIVAEHGLRGGYEPTARLLTEAGCWQVVDALVRGYEGDMSAVEFAPSTVVDAVLALAGDLAEHLVEPADVAAWTGRWSASIGSMSGKPSKDAIDALARARARLALLPLVRAYSDRKRALEAMDFGDQLARAARLARDHPEVGAGERDRFRVVLLDEYQDTSHAQAVLLRALFGGGHPVTAVGDPCQSIYGWRGASAGTLDRFREEFVDVNGTRAARRELSTSWRNRPEILLVANALSRPLRTSGSTVVTLDAAPNVGSRMGDAAVRVALHETVHDEATWIAKSILDSWQIAAEVGPVPAVDIPASARPTTAVLVRVRSQIPAIEAALRARGLPVEVVGLGGLLDTPEIRDVVATLRVLADPMDGAALLRLLTGPRWRLGPRDLRALYRRARELASSGETRTGAASPQAPDPGRLGDASVVDALDDPGDHERYSSAGYRRIAQFGAQLRSLRGRLDQPLADLISDVERTIGLDVEVALRRGDAGLARAHLDEFGEVAARFHAEADGGSLTAFLAYLEAAEEEERGLPPGEVEVVPGAVALLTIHAAKGLEWDVVAVAGLNAGTFPAKAKNADHFVDGLGMVPFPLRGDRSSLPDVNLVGVVDATGVRRALGEFKQAWAAHHEREERRLGYVAVTRPRRLLLCSGYWWGEGVTPRGASAFLTEIRDVCAAGAGVVEVWHPTPRADATNPLAAAVTSALWPGDPLGSARPAWEQAAAAVRAARAALEPDPAPVGPAPVGSAPAGPRGPDPAWLVGSAPAGPPLAGGGDAAQDARWTREVDLLLAERAQLAADADRWVDVELPAELTVSQLVLLREDPQVLAASLRRPLPAAPAPLARRGTAFHAWLEERFGTRLPLLDLDEVPGAADEFAVEDEALERLREAFLASDWGQRTPVAVEVPFAMRAGSTVIRGRMDAVFATGDGSFEVVDWKTGAPPVGTVRIQAAAVALAAYRLAWARLADVPVSRVSAAFHYVAHNRTVRPSDLLDHDRLIALIEGVEPAGVAPRDRLGDTGGDVERG